MIVTDGVKANIAAKSFPHQLKPPGFKGIDGEIRE